jgi:excisionase family DNA binding protein
MLHSINEAARLLGGISPWTLRKHISSGRLRVVRLGRRILLDAAELERIRREGLPSLRAVITSDASQTANLNPQQENQESCLTK